MADNARFTQATQGQLGGTGIGTFSDRLRDAVRGGGPFDENPGKQGLGTGLGTDPNGVDPDDAAAVAGRLANSTDLAQLGLAGNLRSYEFRTYAGDVKRGDAIDYNGSPAGYADQPDEVDQLRRRARQRDAVRRADLQAAQDHPDGPAGPGEHGGPVVHRAVPDPVVLARRHRPAAEQEPGPELLQLR